MGYFPFFADITDKLCLVVGGGRVALRKIQRIKPFGARITVVSPLICAEIREIKEVEIRERAFIASDLDNVDFVVSATGVKTVGEEIFRLCIEKNTPVNTVDDKEKCTFIFPSLITEGDITLGISTGGKSPLFAKYLKEIIQPLINEDNLALLKILEEKRPLIMQKIQSADMRKAVQERLLEMLISTDKPNMEAINLMIEEYVKNEA
ncbi:MAG: bifunctional precorrin-2 dehydrogenase/sirohydrochlorin ferrochelatase [Oscillospiraceae bacterium]|nr:bifunctional precorrin-2 dehydrogenase/sirohydrochlorin ferrochelatase [Oscillospiraceae bacterium]